MSEPEVPICQHIKSNGDPCELAALKGRRYCYFHDEHEKRRRASARITRRLASRERRTINIPVLEDANAIQVALMETIHALIDQRLDRKDAGLLFYALQTASVNAKSLNLVDRPPEPDMLSELYSRRDEIDGKIRKFRRWEDIQRKQIREEVEEELREQAESAQKKGTTAMVVPSEAV